MIDQFYFFHRWGPISYFQSFVRVDPGVMAIMGHSTIPKATTSPSEAI